MLPEQDLRDLIGAATPLLRRLLARRHPAEEILGVLADLAGQIQHDVNVPQDRIGFSGPFNGQVHRQVLFNRLDTLLGFDVMIETGAYRGTTTEMLADLGRPVVSCELDWGLYLRTAARLAGHPAVTLYHLDSRAFLRQLPNASWRMPFCYLDAHWNNDLPLPDEIALIRARFQDFVIFVDDFRHPDPGYGFDRYDTGIELTLDYLMPRLADPQGLAILFPTAPAAEETGARRGTLVLMPEPLYQARLAGETMLMRA